MDEASCGEDAHGAGGDDMGGADALPHDVLVHIFTFVPLLHVLRTCTRVCHTWRAAAEDPLLWGSGAAREHKLSRLAADHGLWRALPVVEARHDGLLVAVAVAETEGAEGAAATGGERTRARECEEAEGVRAWTVSVDGRVHAWAWRASVPTASDYAFRREHVATVRVSPRRITAMHANTRLMAVGSSASGALSAEVHVFAHGTPHAPPCATIAVAADVLCVRLLACDGDGGGGDDGVSTLLLACGDGLVEEWRVGAHVAARRHSATAAHVGGVMSVCAVREWAATAGYDKVVRVWRRREHAWEPVRALTGASETIAALVMDERFVTSCDDSRTVRVWRLADGALVHTGHVPSPTPISAMSECGGMCVVAQNFGHAVVMHRAADGTLSTPRPIAVAQHDMIESAALGRHVFAWMTFDTLNIAAVRPFRGGFESKVETLSADSSVPKRRRLRRM